MQVINRGKTMSHYQRDDADYMANEYDMEDAEYDMDYGFRGRETGGFESDIDEYELSVCEHNIFSY